MSLLEAMIGLFGGIRFQVVTVSDFGGTQLLPDACVETLEVLELYPCDPHGEQSFLKDAQVLADDFIASSSVQDFDLSRNKSLRTLRVTASSIDDAFRGGSASIFLKHVVSTVTSPRYLEVMIVHREEDFHGITSRRYQGQPSLSEVSEADRAEEALKHHRRFEVLREVRRARDFQPVLCAKVCGSVGDYSVRMLKEAVADEKSKGGFKDFRSQPVVIYDPHRYLVRRYREG